MTNYEKFIEIFGETNGKVKASESWLNAEYTGPVTMTERDKFLEWLKVQPCINYSQTEDSVYVCRSIDNVPIVIVSEFNPKQPKVVYVRIDGLCGYKSMDFVREVIRKASREQIDKQFGFDKLYNEIFGR